jgi:hypothetical protein
MNMPDSTPPYRPDSTADDGSGARWMSFTELAAARGISKASAIKLIRRHHWRRQRDNQGHVLALVPLPWTVGEGDEEPDREPDDLAESTTDSTGGISNKNSIFEVALSALREAKDGEIATLRAGLDHAQAQLADAQARGDRAEAALADERVRADQVRVQVDELRRKLDTLQIELRQAQESATDLRQADIARQARGLLARLRDAWRGR